MRAFTQKQNQSVQGASFKKASSSAVASAVGRQGHPTPDVQGTIGNQAVQRMPQAPTEDLEAVSVSTAAPRFAHDFSRIPVHAPIAGTIPANLSVHAADDIHEHEADAIAELVTSMATPLAPQIQRQTAEGKLIRRKEEVDAQAQAAPAIVHEVLRSPGHPLDVATRAFMEPRLGHDFSRVRVHTGPRAEESARSVDARAYTVGPDVVFGAGQYATGSNEGRKLIAHELAHVVQQGFTAQGIQRQPRKKPKKGATTNPKLVHEQIKSRSADLAELITPQSIDFSSPKNPPDIKGGPMKDGEEHHWKVRVVAAQGFAGSQIAAGGEDRKKVKGGVRVTHFLDITWALPLAPETEFLKQTSSEDEAFTLSAAEPLYHELLHARIMMERDPHWTSQHTQVFQGFTDIQQIAGSTGVDKERQELKKQIGALASGGGVATTAAAVHAAEDKFYEFLVHEKYDANTESKAFGKTYPNALIAKRNGEVVARSLGAGDSAFDVLKKNLAAAAEKLFDKLDQPAPTGKPSAPASSAPATGNPEK